jgi:hypothetical protein
MRPKASKMVKALAVAALIAASLAALSGPASAGARNMTESNKTALARRTREVQRAELFRVSRGRMRPNPVMFSQHGVYQHILQNHDLIIREHTDYFGNSMARLGKFYAEGGAEARRAGGSASMESRMKELLRIYDLEIALEKSETLYEIWLAVEESKSAMEALPARAAMAANAAVWASEAFDGDPPESVSAKLEELAVRWPPSRNVFEIEKNLKELAEAYAELFAGIAAERGEGGK